METVVLQSLSKTYSGGKLAVRQVSLALKQGRCLDSSVLTEPARPQL